MFSLEHTHARTHTHSLGFTDTDAISKMDGVVNHINDMQRVSDSYTYVLDGMLREAGQWKVGGAEEGRQSVEGRRDHNRWVGPMVIGPSSVSILSL